MIVTYLATTVRICFSFSQWKALVEPSRALALRLCTETLLGTDYRLVVLSLDDYHLWNNCQAQLTRRPLFAPSAN